MNLSESLQAKLEDALSIEIETQAMLAEARRQATEFLTTIFKSKSKDAVDSAELPFVRLVIQFVTRPFRPFEILLRNAAKGAAESAPLDAPLTKRPAKKKKSAAKNAINLTSGSLLAQDVTLPALC